MENIVRKGEIDCNKQFLHFSQCFIHVPYMALIFHFKCTLKCRLQFVSFGTSLKFCCLVMGQITIAGKSKQRRHLKYESKHLKVLRPLRR